MFQEEFWFLGRTSERYFTVFFNYRSPGKTYCPKRCLQVVGDLEGPVQDYFWAVICKNRRFHHKRNTGYEHRILLGETDAYGSLPMLPEKIKVLCDSCGEEYFYKSKDLMRGEVEVPRHFEPHPLFKGVY